MLPRSTGEKRSLGISISEPYYEAVRTMLAEEKLRLYEQSIAGRPKRQRNGPKNCPG
jgi:hypothetical protein